jgi:DNA-3-methyladenine glycosylase II
MGPFDLLNQNRFFGSWPTYGSDSIVMAFPVEGWNAAAAVVVTQKDDQNISLVVHGDADIEAASSQALAALSLDVDGTEWPTTGTTDPKIGELQVKYSYVRPTLFHSPYEAAAHFIIGHRISMKQGQAVRAKMADLLGEAISVGEMTVSAFPDPRRLLEVSEFPGLNQAKIERLHGIARAALEGRLSRHHLRQQAPEEARRELLNLDGVGPFFAAGILNRGVGIVDDVTDDELTKYAVKTAYGLDELPKFEEVLAIAGSWKPYRMWSEVLLHIWLRREVGLPPRGARI